MSPEQVRGEGHLVDGRSDIFSLGVVLYELLTGRRLFSSTRFAQPAFVEPRPPRQVDDSIPKELERVCLKASLLASLTATARPSTSRLICETFCMRTPGGLSCRPKSPERVATWAREQVANRERRRRFTIVPKGLRSFDRDDAAFPRTFAGPSRPRRVTREREVLEARIQETDPDKTFRVGLIYGPSGCGKSSFLKAGVIPLLGSQIVSLYVESTALESEARLLKALRKGMPRFASLSEYDRNAEGRPAG